jgi:hypothetical protein
MDTNQPDVCCIFLFIPIIIINIKNPLHVLSIHLFVCFIAQLYGTFRPFTQVNRHNTMQLMQVFFLLQKSDDGLFIVEVVMFQWKACSQSTSF